MMQLLIMMLMLMLMRNNAIVRLPRPVDQFFA